MFKTLLYIPESDTLTNSIIFISYSLWPFFSIHFQSVHMTYMSQKTLPCHNHCIQWCILHIYVCPILTCLSYTFFVIHNVLTQFRRNNIYKLPQSQFHTIKKNVTNCQSYPKIEYNCYKKVTHAAQSKILWHLLSSKYSTPIQKLQKYIFHQSE